jgi:hypothetical protein
MLTANKKPSINEVQDIILQYRSRINVKPDHLEGLLYRALNGFDRSTFERTAIPTLAKLFELLTDKNLNQYLDYVLNEEDKENAGYLISRLITFFHVAFRDEYLKVTLDAYEVKHHYDDLDGLNEVGDIHQDYLQKLNN